MGLYIFGGSVEQQNPKIIQFCACHLHAGLSSMQIHPPSKANKAFSIIVQNFTPPKISNHTVCSLCVITAVDSPNSMEVIPMDQTSTCNQNRYHCEHILNTRVDTICMQQETWHSACTMKVMYRNTEEIECTLYNSWWMSKNSDLLLAYTHDHICVFSICGTHFTIIIIIIAHFHSTIVHMLNNAHTKHKGVSTST